MVMLYILRGLSPTGTADKHSLFKTMYIADKCKLAHYGVPIIHDDYIKMENGPVPSVSRDLIKNALDPSFPATYFDRPIQDIFLAKGKYDIQGGIEVDKRYISKIDQECLDYAISLIVDIGIGETGFFERSFITHDSAWESTPKNGKISQRDIMVAGGAMPETLASFDSHAELDHLVTNKHGDC